MAYVAAAVVTTGLVSSYMGSQAAQNAANTQANAANNASGMQWNMYQQQRADQAPWREAGQNALGQIQNNMGYYNQPFTQSQFQQDPGYQFDLQQGQQALQRSAAAKGGLVGGQAMTALSDYSQNQASNEYSNAYNRFNTDRTNSFNRLATIAGLGQTANGQTASAGQNAANQIGNNTMSAGAASAAGQMGSANAITGGIGNAANSWMNYSTMNNLFGNNGGGGNTGLTMPSMSYSPGASSYGGANTLGGTDYSSALQGNPFG